MPIYEYICEDCNIIWEDWKDSIPKKLQKKKKCLKCGSKAELLISAPAIHMKGKIHKVGKQDVMNFYNEAIQDSKDRLKIENTPRPYARYSMDVNKFRKDGLIREVSQEERSKKIQRAKFHTEEAQKRLKKK